jgi:hypothetical protein
VIGCGHAARQSVGGRLRGHAGSAAAQSNLRARIMVFEPNVATGSKVHRM